MADTFLERIVAATRQELAERRARLPLEALRARAAAAPAPRAFAAALRPLPSPVRGRWAGGEGVAPAGPARLIAEVKRASPSKGLLAPNFDPVARARAYAAGGAAAISVLTEPHFFQGSLEHLAAVRAAVDLPLLRKDFLLDPYQVYEARAAGADAVLLLCALLDDAALADLLGLARALGMEALVEAHDAAEVRRAVASGATVIGVNARDLRTFDVDPDVVRHLRPLVPGGPHPRPAAALTPGLAPVRGRGERSASAGPVFVAESGIADALGAARARAWGADAVLVGEALMRSADPAALAASLAAAGGGPLAAFFDGHPDPFVKLCSLREAEHARVAVAAGADAFGLIFAPYPRRVDPDLGRAIVQAARAAWASREGAPHLSLSPRVPLDLPLAPRERGPGGEVRPLAVGVFVDAPLAEIAATAETVGLDAVQLSGAEPPEACAEVAAATGLPVVKAVRLRDAMTPKKHSPPRSRGGGAAALDAYVAAGCVPLIEPPSAAAPGGNGRAGDWALARRAAERWPVLLAGGLTPENVAAALVAVGPRGVDVSSGTETDGAKDPEKLRAFVARARDAALAQIDVS